MSDINIIEERLFLALDAIEKLTEQAEKQQRTTDVQQQTISEQQKTIAEQQQEIVRTSLDKINEVKLTQQGFNQLISNATYKSVNDSIAVDIKNQVAQAIFDATEEAGNLLAESISDAANSIRNTRESASSVVDAMHRGNLDMAVEIRDELEEQKNSLVNKHYKIMLIVSSGIFLMFCMFFYVIYLTTVPTQGQLEHLRYQRAQLISDNQQLQLQKNNLINYRNNNRN